MKRSTMSRGLVTSCFTMHHLTRLNVLKCATRCCWRIQLLRFTSSCIGPTWAVRATPIIVFKGKEAQDVQLTQCNCSWEYYCTVWLILSGTALLLVRPGNPSFTSTSISSDCQILEWMSICIAGLANRSYSIWLLPYTWFRVQLNAYQLDVRPLLGFHVEAMKWRGTVLS